MARQEAGNKSPEKILQEMNKRKIDSVKDNLKELPIDELDDFAVRILEEQESREPELSDKYDLLDIRDITSDIEEASATWGKFGGISTGLEAVDRIIGGLKPAEITLVAGESNNGKSAFVTNIVGNVAKEHDVLYFTLEMLPKNVGARLKHMVGDDYKTLKIHFQKDFRLDYRGLEPVFKKGVESGCKVAVLDYMQYMGVGMDVKEVAKMSRLFSSMAKIYKIPFIVIVSLRKGDKGRDWRTIEVEDIMGTGAIGYDADNIVLISRRDDENNYDTNGLWLKHLKSRDMPVAYRYPFIRFDWDQTKIATDKIHEKFSLLKNNENYAGKVNYKEWKTENPNIAVSSVVEEPKAIKRVDNQISIKTSTYGDKQASGEEIDMSSIDNLFPGYIELK